MVSVVVVNWNAGAALERCLESLAADVAGGAEVVLVDNASTDGSTAHATAAWPGLRVVSSGTNLGFARGANAGAAVAHGDVLVFVNPDARLAPGSLGALVEALGAQPGAARFGVVGHLLLDTTLGRLVERRRGAVREVDWVYGTFMAVRRTVFEALGGFDGTYFLYGEDLDLCHRARERGWRTIHVPAAEAVHARNVSASARFGLAREAAVAAGELRFYARRRGVAAAAGYRVLAAVKFGTKAVLAALAGRPASARRAAHVVRVCLGAPGRVAA
jgi:GT2 family glycosyltransferase